MQPTGLTRRFQGMQVRFIVVWGQAPPVATGQRLMLADPLILGSNRTGEPFESPGCVLERPLTANNGRGFHEGWRVWRRALLRGDRGSLGACAKAESLWVLFRDLTRLLNHDIFVHPSPQTCDSPVSTPRHALILSNSLEKATPQAEEDPGLALILHCCNSPEKRR
jgi:hypothetical protein